MIKGISNAAITEAPWMTPEDINPYSVGAYSNEALYANASENMQWHPALDNEQGLVTRWSEDESVWDVYFYSVQLEKNEDWPHQVRCEALREGVL